jgi:hypothetical protein
MPGADLPLATIGSTRQFDIPSASNGEAYRIQIFIPGSAPPPGGFPNKPVFAAFKAGL